MGIEDWVFKCTKLTTNTKKQRLKIWSRDCIFKNIIKKRRRRRGKKEKTKSRELFKNNNHKIYIYMAFALKMGTFF